MSSTKREDLRGRWRCGDLVVDVIGWSPLHGGVWVFDLAPGQGRGGGGYISASELLRNFVRVE